MLSTALATTLSGVGAYASASFLPSEEARVAARLAGLGLGAVGVAMLVGDLKRGGGLAQVAGDILGDDLGETTTRQVMTVPEPKVTGNVIPFSGRFVRPLESVKHNLFRFSYPLRILLQNFTGAPVVSSFIVDADEEYLTSSETVHFVHEPVTVPAAGELEVAFDMPMAPSLGANLTTPHVVAKLTWPADFPYQPRGQDVAEYRVR